jgi:hypothetical protein
MGFATREMPALGGERVATDGKKHYSFHGETP